VTTHADLLELGAREAVDRIRRGELKAEAYAVELLKQYDRVVVVDTLGPGPVMVGHRFEATDAAARKAEDAHVVRSLARSLQRPVCPIQVARCAAILSNLASP